MKKLILIGAVFTSLVTAEYLEVKTGGGKAYYNTNTKPRLYVCYNKRLKYISQGIMYLRYDGCARYTHSCASNGKARFGKYPSQRATKNALHRCQTANPKFID